MVLNYIIEQFYYGIRLGLERKQIVRSQAVNKPLTDFQTLEQKKPNITIHMFANTFLVPEK
jgi:hypothetical protein